MIRKKKVTVIERKRANKFAGILAGISGVLLILSGISGVAVWGVIKDIAEKYLGSGLAFVYFFYFLILLSSLGGLIVIFGGVLLIMEKVRIAKFLITLGVGVGGIGFLFILISLINHHTLFNISSSGIGFFGLLFSVLARLRAQKVEIKILD